MAYDSARQVVVLHGGSAVTPGGDAETWEWNGQTWTPRAAGGPIGRFGHGLAYDASRQRTVLFGGATGNAFHNDTWEWDGVSWELESPATRPAARRSMGMVYDPFRQRILMFGGGGQLRYLDTWEYDGVNWIQREPTTVPTPTNAQFYATALAFDSARNRGVLEVASGFSAGQSRSYEWNGSNWLLTGTSGPSLGDGAIVFDSNRQRVVWFGGTSLPNFTTVDQTWEYDSVWSQVMVSPRPSPRRLNAMAYDAARRQVVLFGGQLAGSFGDTWVYGALATDTTPPDVVIRAPGNGVIVNATQIQVDASITDASATAVSSVPQGVVGSLPAGGGAASGIVALAAEGENVITVNATDSAGNRGGSSVVVIRDTIAPRILSKTPGDTSIVSSASVDVTIAVQDANSTTVSIGANVIPLPAGGGNATVSVTLTEGPNLIPILVTDAAGNARPDSLSLVLDTTAPLVDIVAPISNSWLGVEGRTVAVRAEITDSTTTVVSLNPGGQSATVPPGNPSTFSSTAALAEGLNAIVVSARDATNQVGSHSITVSVDTTPPDITVVSPTNGSSVSGIVDFQVRVQDNAPGGAAGSGIELVQLSLDQIPLSTSDAFSGDTRLLADGWHAFSATATDRVGNVSQPTTARVFVDNTLPSVAIQAPTELQFVGGTATLRVLAEDSGAGLAAVSLRAEGSNAVEVANATYPSPVASDSVVGDLDTRQFPDGPLNLAAIVTDAAGNASTRRIVVMVRNSAPPTCMLVPGDGSVVSGIIAISATMTGPFASVEICIAGVSYGTSASTPFFVDYDTRSRLDGPLPIEAFVTDIFSIRTRFAVTLLVDNIAVELTPKVLSLSAKGDPLTARLEGASVGLLLPTESNGLQLRVPGGSPVTADTGWHGDDAVTDTNGNGVPELRVRFSRLTVTAAIRAGLANGTIQPGQDVPITLVGRASTGEETTLGIVIVRIARL